MIARKFQFSVKALDSLPVPEKRDIYYDEEVRGLTLFVTPTAKVFYYYRKVKGRPVQLKLGEYPGMRIKEARDQAAVLNASKGTDDPRAVMRRGRHERTVGELVQWYIDHHAKLRKKTVKQDEDRIAKYLGRYENWPASHLTKSEVRAMHSRIGATSGKSAANKMLFLLRTIFNRAIANDIWEGSNPTTGIEPFKEKSRDRRLMPSEVPKFFAAVMAEPNETVRDFVLLALFTGARKSNVLTMRWEQLDLTARSWRIPETKNGLPQVVPLGDPEVEILARRRATSTSPWVLPGGSVDGHLSAPLKGWQRILERAGMGKHDLRIHDLRRTLGSWMVDTGATLAVIGHALNHQSPSSTAIYARLSIDPVRAAKDKAVSALVEASKKDTNGGPR